MTTIYNDYQKAYSEYLYASQNNLPLDGIFNMENVNLGCILVDDSYIPNINDKPFDLEGYIIYAPKGLFDDVLLKEGMSEIMSRMKQRLLTGAKANPDLIDEKYREAFLNETDNNMVTNVWSKLKELGAKYIITYSTEFNICCFCEQFDSM